MPTKESTNGAISQASVAIGTRTASGECNLSDAKKRATVVSGSGAGHVEFSTTSDRCFTTVAEGHSQVMIDVEIAGPTIRLGQLLKLSGLVESGGAARPVLATGAVTVNGSVEVRRGRQLQAGDVVTLRGQQVRVVGAGP